MKDYFKNSIKPVLKSQPWVIAIMLVAGVVLGLAVSGRISESNKNTRQTNCDGICVQITPEGMQPNELAVKVGQFVQFNSADGKKHNLADGDGAHNSDSGHNEPNSHDHKSEFSSGDFGADEAWRVQFNKAGTYKFHDHYDPEQNILVVVYEEK